MNLELHSISLCTLAASFSSNLILKEDGYLALVALQRAAYYQAAGQAPMGKPVKIALAGWDQAAVDYPPLKDHSRDLSPNRLLLLVLQSLEAAMMTLSVASSF